MEAEANGKKQTMRCSNDLPGGSGVVRWFESGNSEVVRGKRTEESQDSALKWQMPVIARTGSTLLSEPLLRLRPVPRLDTVLPGRLAGSTRPFLRSDTWDGYYLDFLENLWLLSSCSIYIMPYSRVVSLRRMLFCSLAPTLEKWSRAGLFALSRQRLHLSTSPAPPLCLVDPCRAASKWT